MAAFAQVRYDLVETTDIDAGVRYNHEEIDVAFQRLNRPGAVLPNNATCLDTCTEKDSDNNFQAQFAVVQPDRSVVFQLNNVGRLRTRSVEVERQTKPSRALSLDFEATYLDAVVKK